jgi:hypothetical protein
VDGCVDVLVRSSMLSVGHRWLGERECEVRHRAAVVKLGDDEQELCIVGDFYVHVLEMKLSQCGVGSFIDGGAAE